MDTKKTIKRCGIIASLLTAGVLGSSLFVLHAANKVRAIFMATILMIVAVYIVDVLLRGEIQEYKDSKVLRYFRTHGWYLALLAVVSAMLAFIAYPGIWYSDSYTRANLAFSMEEIIEAALQGSEQVYLHPYTPIASLMMALCIAITGNIAFYTMMQAFFLLLAISLFLERVLPKTSQKVIGVIAFLTSPLIICTATYYETGVGCMTGMLLLVVVLSHTHLENPLDRYLQIISTVACSIVVFGYRVNAFTIIPVLAAALFLFYGKGKELCIMAVSIAAGILLVQGFPVWANIETTMSSAEAFMWETITAIQDMPEEQQQQYMTYFDDLAGEGATRKSIEVNNADNICPIIFGQDTITRKTLQQEGAQSLVIKKYLSFAAHNKMQYLKTKLHFVFKMMGITQPLRLYEWQYNTADAMDSYNYNDSLIRHEYFDSYTNFVANRPVLLRPWILFLVALAFLLLSRGVEKENRLTAKIEWITYFMAVFYFGAFLINTQSMEFRYFYPSCVLLLLISFSTSIRLVYQLLGSRLKYKLSLCSKSK